MATRFGPINWIQWVTLLLIPVIAVSTVLLWLQLSNEQAHQNDALRSIICQAEHVVKTRPGIPAKQRQQALEFYKRASARAHLAPCDNK